MQVIHISKIVDLKQLSLGQAKQFLPFHQKSILQNVSMIINNFSLSSFSKNVILIYDENLNLNYVSNTCFYIKLKAIWSENVYHQSEILRNSLMFGCTLLNHIQSIDEQCNTQKMDQSVEIQVKSSQIYGIINTQRVQQKKNQYYNQQKQARKIIGYKLILKNEKVYCMMGLSPYSKKFYTFSCAMFRKWNLCRLQIDEFRGNEVDSQFMSIICQHLFNIGRGFIREVASDNNTYRSGVHEFLKNFEKEEINTDNLCLVFNSHRVQNSSSLPHEIIIMKYQIVLSKDIKQNMLFGYLMEIVTEWLFQTPLTYSCSYSSYLKVDKDRMIILLGSYYQISTGHTFPTSTTLNNGAKSIQLLLGGYSYKKLNIEQDSFQVSVQLLDRYQAPRSTPVMLPKTIDPFNRVFFHNLLSDLFVHEIENKKVQINDISKLGNQIYEILKKINQIKEILTPQEIQDTIRKYVRKILLIYQNDYLTLQEYDALMALDAINELITAEELHLILTKNMRDSSSIIKYFIPKGKYQRVISLGKLIATEHLDELYKKNLKEGLSSSRYTIILHYLKKIVNVYGQQSIKIPIIDVEEVSIPNLLEIIENKNYQSHFYQSIITIVCPQLLTPFIAVIKILAPLLNFFIELLLSGNHHEQLVFSFIGELLFEICYFPTESNLCSLSNVVYLQEKHSNVLSLKQKKILQLVRDGGLKGFGYEIKTRIMQTIQRNKDVGEFEEVLYRILKVQKPKELQLLYRLLGLCRYTETLNKISRYLQMRNYFAQSLSQEKSLIGFVLTKNKGDNPELKKINEMKQNNDTDFNSISDRILSSESRIFYDMVKLNPNIKIAGIELKNVMKNPNGSPVKVLSSKERGEKNETNKGRIDEQQAVQTYVTKQLKQGYEFIELARSMKQKYLRYPSLSQNEKVYFRNCALAINDNKKIMNEYFTFSTQMSGLRKILREEGKLGECDKKQESV